MKRLKYDMWVLAGFAAVPLSVIIAAFAKMTHREWLFDAFWVDNEIFDKTWSLHFNFPVIVSAIFLLAAGLVWIWLSGSTDFEFRKSAVLFGGFIVFMGFDEVIRIHEQIEAAIGVDWQLLYAPIIGIGALAWGNLVLRLKGAQRDTTIALILGAALWGVSQVLELIQWDGGTPRPGYIYMVMIEEILESWGSLMFLQAGILALRRERWESRMIESAGSRLGSQN